MKKGHSEKNYNNTTPVFAILFFILKQVNRLEFVLHCQKMLKKLHRIKKQTVICSKQKLD